MKAMYSVCLQPIPAARDGANNFKISFYFTTADVSAMTSADAETHIVHRADTDNPHADLASGLTGSGNLQTTGSVRLAHAIVVASVLLLGCESTSALLSGENSLFESRTASQSMAAV